MSEDPNNRRSKSLTLLLFLIVAGVVLGIILGISLRYLAVSHEVILLISYPGELFFRVLKLLILPLIISSVITGTSKLNVRGRIALKTLTCFFLFSACSALLGVLFAIVIRPGVKYSTEITSNQTSFDTKQSVMDGFLDLGRNIFADNIVQATFQQVRTEYVNSTIITVNLTGGNVEIHPIQTRILTHRYGTNTLGVVFFCLMIGSNISGLGKRATVFVELFSVIFELSIALLTKVMWVTPIGITSIIAGKILTVDDVSLIISQVGWFILTVAAGILTYQLVVLQLVYYTIVKKNPFKFYFGLWEAILTAFTTASESAALPVTLKLMDEKVHMDPRVSRFVIPLGCNLNMNGTALFLAVSGVFISQMTGKVLHFGDMVTIFIAATLTSFSSVGVPSAGVALVGTILSTVHIPFEEASLLLAIDWLVDRVRTPNNLLGDCYTAAVIEKWCYNELEICDQNSDYLLNAGRDKASLAYQPTEILVQ
ncbi:excitatory amino acid transporter 2 isoform X2 [Cylas formicarius]|uniref:excitatory amino acid transporter 2 isoform X2 n=1 Tax=Cylas formicarius TaxID=197179 RepID=UPI002958D477|nr:excitatory amino acid transporter 2 isoform X2 [Cylas formicarius]